MPPQTSHCNLSLAFAGGNISKYFEVEKCCLGIIIAERALCEVVAGVNKRLVGVLKHKGRLLYHFSTH